jgi:hypothetical protein
MNPASLESFLALIYADPAARARFKADPAGEAQRAGLSPEEALALSSLNWSDLQLASRSFANKRRAKSLSKRGRGLWQRCLRALRLTS